MTPANRELEWFAVFVHGALASGHALAAVFNWRVSGKARDQDAWFHSIGCAYSVWSALRHAKRLG